MLISFCAISISAQKTDIKLNLKEGDSYLFKMAMNNVVNQDMMGMKVQVDQNMTTETGFNVIGIAENGNYLVKQTYKRVVMDISTNGQKMHFDSDAEDAAESPLSSIKKIVGVTLTYELSPKGDVSNVKGIDKLLQDMAPAQAKMLSEIADKDKLSNIFSYMPKEKVTTGDSYTKTVKLKEVMGIEVETKYTIESINTEKASIKLHSDIEFNPDKPIEQDGMKMKMEGKGTQSGVYQVNLKTGMADSAKTEQDLDMTIRMKNPQTGKDMSIPMKMTSIIRFTVIKE